jgi:hypothetical protein
LRLQIGGSGEFHWQKQSTNTGTSDGFFAIRGEGAFTDDRFVATGDFYCHARDRRGRYMIDENAPLVFTFDGESIELTGDLHTRTGG